MEDALTVRALRAIDERVFPGCVVGLSKNGKQCIRPFGDATANTIYDLASVTKSIPLASLVTLLIEEGKLSLDDRVAAYLPELQHDQGATIEDLLRYRVKGLRLSTIKVRTFEELRTHVLESGFDAPPGASSYTNLPALILGFVIERITHESLAALSHRYFFEPLSMADTTFFPHDLARVAASEVDARGEVRGLPHDESAYLFAQARRSAGHAGLFSTTADLLTFLTALINGKYPAVSHAAQQGLGWSVHEPFFMGAYSGEHAFGKTGFTGTSVVCDVKRKTALVILSNRCYPRRPDDPVSPESAINVFRREVADIVFGSD